MQIKKDSKTYIVGMIRGAVIAPEQEAKRGEVVEGCSINLAAILQNVNRAVVLGDSSTKKEVIKEKVADFKAAIAEEDKARAAAEKEQRNTLPALIAQMKALQGNIAALEREAR